MKQSQSQQFSQIYIQPASLVDKCSRVVHANENNFKILLSNNPGFK